MNQLIRLMAIALVVVGIAAYSDQVFAHMENCGECDIAAFHDSSDN